MSYPHLFHINVFTKDLFRGNSAGVVLDADTLTTQQMQALARELKHSETAFVMKALADDHEVFIRYFTPTTEVPSCGHASIAAHFARAHKLALNDTQLRQKNGAGIQTVYIEKGVADYHITLRQGEAWFGDPLSLNFRTQVAQALGLEIDDFVPDLPVQIVSTGHSKVIIPLRQEVDIDAILPDHAALTQLSARLGCNGFFPFVLRAKEHATDGRMFAPAIGIPEDPVTGNANGPLGAYLVRYDLMQHDGARLTFHGHQGRAIGRDGVVEVMVDIEQGQPSQVFIKGDAVILFDAPLRCDL